MKAACHAWERSHTICCLARYISSASKSSTTSSDGDDNNDRLTACGHIHTEEMDHHAADRKGKGKGKGPSMKW